MPNFYAFLKNEVCDGVIELAEPIVDPAYISIPDLSDTYLRRPYVNGVWGAPPALPPNYMISGPAWVERFTDQEWKWLKGQRAIDNAAGNRLDQMMDAIRWTNSIDVSTANMDEFYNWLLAQGIPGGQARIDVLRSPQ
jgi:hypothetical protein